MFERIKSLFRRKSEVVGIEGCDCPFEAACIMEAFNTGNMVIGTRDENGKMTMKSIPLKK